MAVKQYIGARYVPLLDGDYDVNKTYEPLTTVNYGNATYTSKKTVPAGIVPTDSNYWMQTGFGNQQVSSLLDWKNNTVDPYIQQSGADISGLQGDVSGLHGDISGLQGDVSGLQGDISGLQGDITGLQDDITGLEGDVTNLSTKIDAALINKKILFVSDSYGQIKYSDKNISELFTQYTGTPSDLVWQGSTGFGAALKFTSTLSSYTGDKNMITKIIVVGGANDLPASGADILSGMQDFVSYAKTNFPNLREISVFACGVAFNGAGVTYIQRNNLIRNYISAASITGVSIVTNSQYVLHDNLLLESDLVHPNSAGINEIVKCLSECYINDVANIDRHVETSISLYPGNAMSEMFRVGWMKQNLKNGNASLTAKEGLLLVGSFTGDNKPFIRQNGTSSVAAIGIVRQLIFNGDTSAAGISQARVTLSDGSVRSGFAFLYFTTNNGGTFNMYFVLPDYVPATTVFVNEYSLYNTYIPMMAD